MRQEMQSQIDALNEQLRKERENMDANAKERERQLMQEIENLNRAIGNKTAEIDHLKDQCNQLNNTIEHQKTQIGNLEKEIEGLKDKI